MRRNNNRHFKMSFQHKLTLTYAIVTTIAALILAQFMGESNIILMAISAALVGLLLGVWPAHLVARRLQRVLEISRLWLRGDLSLRLTDPAADELGLLARQLNSLAQHLEQDEQDLAELRKRNTRLTDQVRALAVVEERNRLARELHDSVKQHLFSLTMTASAIRTHFDTLPRVPDNLAEMVNEIETTAKSAQGEMTRLIEDLRTDSFQDKGLAAALNDYTLLFGAQEHILIYLDVQGNDALLPSAVAETLYRVAQEALHNVVRHARATRVDVHLRCILEQVALIIYDNGVGFDSGQTRQGLGLTNMQERMMAIGGRLTIKSQPGAGTTLLAEVGLTHALDSQMQVIKHGEYCPKPVVENWPWLGKELVVPVGQTWPWLPADQVHLRRPLVEPGEMPLVCKPVDVLGFRRGYTLQMGPHYPPLVRVYRHRSSYRWKAEGVWWTLRRVHKPKGGAVLSRKNQPLAAMQYQGRQLNIWSEIVYDGRGYSLFEARGESGQCMLIDEAGEELLVAEGGTRPQIILHRPLPLSLLVMVATRFADKVVSTTTNMKESV
jgi:NarL family two-component system sensor histidine kinase LiaS